MIKFNKKIINTVCGLVIEAGYKYLHGEIMSFGLTSVHIIQYCLNVCVHQICSENYSLPCFCFVLKLHLYSIRNKVKIMNCYEIKPHTDIDASF